MALYFELKKCRKSIRLGNMSHAPADHRSEERIGTTVRLFQLRSSRTLSRTSAKGRNRLLVGSLLNGRSWRNAVVPEVRGVFWSWMKSRLTAGVIVCLRTVESE